MVVIDGVVYRMGVVLDPASGLHFVGFSADGNHLLFKDGAGALYARGI